MPNSSGLASASTAPRWHFSIPHYRDNRAFMGGRAWTVRSNGRKALNASLGCSLGNSQLTEDPKSSLSSFKMSAPECIWKHFSNWSPGQKWGRDSTWRECVCRQTCEWVQADRPHIFSSWNFNMHSGTLLFLHLNDVSSFG